MAFIFGVCFCFVRRGSSLVLGFDQIINLTNANSPKTMCCMSGGTKTMTKINAEGRAWGTGKIWPGRRSWLILPVRGMIQLGFKSMTPEGSKLPTFRTGLF
jgi:hypothetical protein